MCKTLAFSHEIHLDVVDGVFVPFTSWPYLGEGNPLETKAHTDPFTLEVDLMVVKPFEAARLWESAGADMVVFHVETIDEASLVDFVQHTSMSVGISLHGETQIESLLPYLTHVDYVQLMGITQIGQQGQPFDLAVLDKISYIQKKAPQLPISVDGSVGEDTIDRLLQAGVDRFIVGSAIVKQENPLAAYQALRLHCA